MNNDLRTQFLSEYSEEILARSDRETAARETLEAANHLDEMIAANMELGDNEDEAIANAIALFGRSKEIGKQVGDSIQSTRPSKLVFWFAMGSISFLFSFAAIFAADRIAWSAGMYTYSFVETDLGVAGVFTAIYSFILALAGRHRSRGILACCLFVAALTAFWFVPQISARPRTPSTLLYLCFSTGVFTLPLVVLLQVLNTFGPKLDHLQQTSKPIKLVRRPR